MASFFHRCTSSLRSRSGSVAERLGRYFVIALLLRAVRELSDDDGTHMAASVAYHALFSLFPLLLGLIAFMSLFLESQDVQDRLTDFTTSYLPGSESLVDRNIDTVLQLRGAVGAIAILGLLWSGSAVFGAVTRAVNRAWDVHRDRPFFISKPRQLTMALAVSLLFLVSLAASTIVRTAERFYDSDVAAVQALVHTGGQFALQGTSFVLMLAVFLLIYRFMPNTRTYWRYIWPGALVAAVLFELTKNVFIVYLDRVANFENVYGALAPVIVLLMWTYVSSIVLIFGAELSSEYGRLKQGVGRGVLIHPHHDPADHGDESI